MKYFKEICISLLVLMFSCDIKYYNNRYKITDVSIRLLEWKGKDNNNCTIVSEVDTLSATSKLALAIKFRKEYYSDSSFIPLSAMGKEGMQGSIQKMKSLSFIAILGNRQKINLTNYLKGEVENNYLTKSNEFQVVHFDTPYNLRDCVYTELFSNTDSLVSVFNLNNTSILLDNEIIFWLSEESVKNLAKVKNLDKLVFKIEFETRKTVSDSLVIVNAPSLFVD